jgi:hypothetical protein
MQQLPNMRFAPDLLKDRIALARQMIGTAKLSRREPSVAKTK